MPKILNFSAKEEAGLTKVGSENGIHSDVCDTFNRFKSLRNRFIHVVGRAANSVDHQVSIATICKN